MTEESTCSKGDWVQVLLGGNPFHHPMLGHDQQDGAHTLIILYQHIGSIYHLQMI